MAPTGVAGINAYPGQVFRRSQPDPVQDPETVDVDPMQASKGRPTPTRKEAEAARKQSLKVPSDPKAAKRALRDRERQERALQREALMRGDERALPARDRGPGKAFVRRWVDSRRLLSEYFIFIALAVLALSFIPSKVTQVLVFYGWVVMLAILVGETGFVVFRVRRALAKEFPNPEDRKGCLLYTVMRAIQIRRLRLPPPQVRPGGKPVKPKAGKN